MPRASRQKVDKPIWVEIHNTLFEFISSYSKEDLEKFLGELLTKEEKIMFTKRLALWLMIVGGYNEADIKEVLKVSRETIRQAKNSLPVKSEKFKSALSGWAKEPERPKSTSKLLGFIDTALAAKSNTRARAKLVSGDY